MTAPPIRLGVVGLGRAFTLMLPTFRSDPRVVLVAAADERKAARERFAAAFGARVYDDVASMCADPDMDAVYVATPHQFHAAHTILAASYGKHVLVEKPMAIDIAECQAMIEACDRAGVHLIVGHSHSFDAPVRRARELIDAGTIGKVRMINAQYYTDFLYRFRRPEELDSSAGGGVLWSQAAHQVDIVRVLGGGEVARVRALTGAWDAARPTEGAYAALLTFRGGEFASLLYSGYGHFDSDVFCDDFSELGQRKDRARYGIARKSLANVATAADEAEAKATRNDATFDRAVVAPAAGAHGSAVSHEHFGVVIVSGERGDLRLLPHGVMVYGDAESWLDAVAPPQVPRVEVIDELYGAVVNGRALLHDGRWALATLEVCIAMLQSARAGTDVELFHQRAIP